MEPSFDYIMRKIDGVVKCLTKDAHGLLLQEIVNELETRLALLEKEK